MLRVGLSGGIGSGKSTVAERLVAGGAVLVDADRLAREIVEPGTSGLAELVDRFGERILDGGALDRAALAELVFGDEQARADLNAITHPRIRELTEQRMADAPGDAVVVHDIPLLVEAGYGADYDLVVIVDAPEELRVQRLIERGLTESDARARIRAQATPEQRREAADVWIDNSGSVEEVRATVDELWHERLVPFEENLRLGRRARSARPRIVPSDPDWPAQARRLIGRVERAAGAAAVRVDHIGSTAVPGLPAKDVIDLQLTVRSIADADDLGPALAAAGFPEYAAARSDTPHGSAPDAAEWIKRLHQSADPGRPANLHVRVQGTAAQRIALLFPAWLRADEAARAQYAQLKQDVAEQHTDVEDYAAAKEPWFAEAVPAAERWAAETNFQP
ncbi:dephospho-CoA kinase [Saccharopolyspora sp. HNM0983]|uniref:Dephospho-CoA kinase n=1 Tax=Saccharopolyspora montiporae TaxID=2781240 RepID=A0A929G181_9PSEU|nr:dephospho-CoA kinase [Saccharopolyspora sp. HNM0983]